MKSIKKCKPKADLDPIAEVFLEKSLNGYRLVSEHMLRVSRLAEETAKMINDNPIAAFSHGLTHDIGKLVLPHSLFDGHSISSEEYELVKQHVFKGFEYLKNIDISLAFCAGFHHALGRSGYGINFRELPPGWSFEDAKKAFRTTMIIAICDFIDAYCTRKTRILDGSNNNHCDLEGMLEEKYFYSGCRQIIEAALEANKELNL